MALFIIDAGHGLYTSGKRCMKKLDPNETREWTLNDRVADYLEAYLKSAGHTVKRVDDVTGKTDPSLSTRVSRANSTNAVAFISVHHNAGINGGSGGGTVVYTCKGCQKKSTEMQNAVYKRTIETAGLKGNRWDATLQENFTVVAETTMPAILIECGFMDSSTDIKYILNSAWSKKMAYGIALGVCDVFGGTVKNDSVTSTPKPTTAPTTDTIYRVQVGAFRNKANAESLVKELKSRGYDAIIK